MVDLAAVAAAKDEVRTHMWDLLTSERASRFPGAQGRIPNFVGAERAAERLTELPEWQAAQVVKANPDSPQLAVRKHALAAGKRVYMAVPRLIDEHPFILLDPARLAVPPHRAASIKGAGEHGIRVAVDELPRVDLVVCGTVTVSTSGVRVGKGGGFSDLEFGLLTEACLVDADTTIVTTVHPLQLTEETLPEADHDFSVDVIVTPHDVHRTDDPRRPPGILWDHLSPAKIAEIPVLDQLNRRRR